MWTDGWRPGLTQASHLGKEGPSCLVLPQVLLEKQRVGKGFRAPSFPEGQFEVPNGESKEGSWEVVRWQIWSSSEAQCPLGAADAAG